MLQAVLSTLFGCSHRKTTFPITVQRKTGACTHRSTYVVCLRCGAEFGYDWRTMRIQKPLNMPTPAPDLRKPVEELSGRACRL
jgi:hypothetical protein